MNDEQTLRANVLSGRLYLSTIKDARIPSVLRPPRCRSDTHIHRQSRNGGGIKFGIKANVVRHRLELFLDDNNLRLELSSSQRAPTKSMEGGVESIKTHVLDDYCAGTRVGLGG